MDCSRPLPGGRGTVTAFISVLSGHSDVCREGMSQHSIHEGIHELPSQQARACPSMRGREAWHGASGGAGGQCPAGPEICAPRLAPKIALHLAGNCQLIIMANQRRTTCPRQWLGSERDAMAGWLPTRFQNSSPGSLEQLLLSLFCSYFFFCNGRQEQNHRRNHATVISVCPRVAFGRRRNGSRFGLAPSWLPTFVELCLAAAV